MRLMKIGIPVLLVSAFALPGQENGDLETWMKSAGASLGVLRKLEKKTGPEAVANAEKLGGIYENMIGFWRQRNAEDAVKLSAEGKAAAVELASAANADDEEQLPRHSIALAALARHATTRIARRRPRANTRSSRAPFFVSLSAILHDMTGFALSGREHATR